MTLQLSKNEPPPTGTKFLTSCLSQWKKLFSYSRIIASIQEILDRKKKGKRKESKIERGREGGTKRLQKPGKIKIL